MTDEGPADQTHWIPLCCDLDDWIVGLNSLYLILKEEHTFYGFMLEGNGFHGFTICHNVNRLLAQHEC